MAGAGREERSRGLVSGARELEKLEEEEEIGRRRRGAKSGAGPRASVNGPRCRLGKEEEEGVEAVRGPMERRRGPVTSGLREDSDWGGLTAGGSGTQGRSGRWQTPRGPRRV